MAALAFHDDPAVKEQALAKLRHHIEGGTFRYYPAWSEDGANPVGSIVEADDPQKYTDMLGYPLALATALPALVAYFVNLAEAAAYSVAWLERTPVGANLSKVVSQALVEVLQQPALVSLTSAHPGIEASRRGVIDLHRQAVEGQDPDRVAWKTARRAAIAASDTVTDNPLLQKAGAVVEAAAWPGSMRTGLHDVLGARGGLETRQLLAESGWTDELESQVFRIREQAETTGRFAELTGIDRVLALLDADHPELASGFRQRMQQFEKLGDAGRAVAWRIIGLLEQAPVAGERRVDLTAEGGA